MFDASYGFLGRDGPCYDQDASWRPRWAADSVDGDGKAYDLEGDIRLFSGMYRPLAGGARRHGTFALV